MKKQKIEFLILLIITMLFMLSCRNSNKSNVEVSTQDNSNNDDYALLRGVNPSPRIVEDLSGTVIILTENDFIERITALDHPKGFQYLGHTPCIVELYADWCKPCGYLSELMRKMAPAYQGKVIFYKLNIDKAPYIKLAFNVENIPKILYFKPFCEVKSTVGYLNEEKLTRTINEFLLNP